MTGNTPRMAFSLGQENRLYFSLKELKIQACGGRGCSFLGPQRNRGRTLNQQRSRDYQQHGDAHNTPPRKLLTGFIQNLIERATTVGRRATVVKGFEL